MWQPTVLRWLAAATCNVLQALRAVLVIVRVFNQGASIAPSDEAACRHLHHTLTSSIPSWVQGIPVEEQQLATDLVTALSAEIEHMPRADVAELTNAILSALEQNKPHCCSLLELLPLSLGRLSTAAHADQGGSIDSHAAHSAAADADGADESDAASHLQAAVHRLLQCKWQAEQVNQLLQVGEQFAVQPNLVKNFLSVALLIFC